MATPTPIGHIPRDLGSDPETDPEVIRLREQLRHEIRRTEEARIIWESGFVDSLFAIKRFLNEEAGGGRCLESLDRESNWIFEHFSIYWRHLAGRKRALCYLPLLIPKDPDIEVLRPSEIPGEDRKAMGFSLRDNVFFIRVRPGAKSEGVKRARHYAERNGMREWLK